MKRRAGSVRFDPYWKLQWYDDHAFCWRDIQRAYATRDAARAAATAGRRWRLMRVWPAGREAEGSWRT